ncbi:MAG: hypothetical protein HQK89_05605 [Nitrospirae bacterium]|nr:hypothetical protein [Nitrospirota bacterium]
MTGKGVAITGMGLVTSLGTGVQENFAAVTGHKTGLARYPREGCPENFQYMGKVNLQPYPFEIPVKLQSQMKFLNRGSVLGFAAALDAIRHAGLHPAYGNPLRTGAGNPPQKAETVETAETEMAGIAPSRRALYVASGDLTKVGYDFMYPALKDATRGTFRNVDTHKLNSSTLKKVNPFFLLESISNNLFSVLSAFVNFMGPNTTIATLSPCGAQALEFAARSISQGRADIALAVGCGNWITEVPLYEMSGLGLLSRCLSGERSFRPFDRTRDGFIPSEGGAAIVLENEQVAKQRGATIHAVVRGFGSAIEYSGGSSISVPDMVIERVIEGALRDAGLDLEDMAFICPHGSATVKGDRSELNSVRTLCGGAAVPVCGLKPYTGHMAAASDIAEAIIGVMALKNGMVPGTLNFRGAGEAFKTLPISANHVPTNGKVFVTISYGLGAQSSAVVLEAV